MAIWMDNGDARSGEDDGTSLVDKWTQSNEGVVARAESRPGLDRFQPRIL